ncbi:MAG: restriction endonuclease [Actinopolymorphaceae bacterium]
MVKRWQRTRTKRQLTEQERHREELHIQQMSEDAVVRSEKTEQRVQRLKVLLHASLSRPVEPVDFEHLKRSLPTVDLGTDADPHPLPHWEEYAPRPTNLLTRLLTRAARRTTEEEAEVAYASALERYRADEAERQRRIEELRRSHANEHATELQKALAHNASIDEFRDAVLAGDRKRASEYFTRVFATISDRSSFPRDRRFAYVPESKLLLVEWQLPSTDVVPREKEFRFNKATDSVSVYKWRSASELRGVYHDLIAQMGLRAANTGFGADPAGLVETVVFNGMVTTDDGTSACLITMSVSRRRFSRLNLDDLGDALELVRKQCGAEVSPYPEELAGVTPILSYDLADPSVAPATASRAPDLATAPIEEFWRLVERLLERMGYSVTALDGAAGSYLATSSGAEPGRKVVHVRRSADRLETSEVRGLASAVRRERADGGMLLTTSGLDPQAYDYAHRRPLRLFDGHNVLALCQQHGLPARIESVDSSGAEVPGSSAVPEQRHDRTPSSADR